jgi:hypothetical protein
MRTATSLKPPTKGKKHSRANSTQLSGVKIAELQLNYGTNDGVNLGSPIKLGKLYLNIFI